MMTVYIILDYSRDPLVPVVNAFSTRLKGEAYVGRSLIEGKYGPVMPKVRIIDLNVDEDDE